MIGPSSAERLGALRRHRRHATIAMTRINMSARTTPMTSPTMAATFTLRRTGSQLEPHTVNRGFPGMYLKQCTSNNLTIEQCIDNDSAVIRSTYIEYKCTYVNCIGEFAERSAFGMRPLRLLFWTDLQIKIHALNTSIAVIQCNF